jgi:phosphatidylglycerol:prolipoprotein diacylglycerol transferase
VGTPLDTPLHPSQLYESLATLLIFTVLVWLAPRKKFQGQVVLAYVTLYSIARFFLEYYRGDAGRGYIGPLSTSQAVAVVLVVLAGVLYARLRKTEAVAPPAPQAPAAA